MNNYYQNKSLAKAALTREINDMFDYVNEIFECAQKPITTGKLAGSGFFWFNGEIRSPHWAQRQKEELESMIRRRKKMDQIGGAK